MTRSARRDPTRFVICQSTLGKVLVGATDRGVCAVFLADDDDALVAELHASFPGARTTRVRTLDSSAAVLRCIEGHGDSDVVLDCQGTDFQQRVWAALRTIESGDTVTYAEIAQTLGKPSAARAVAGACAANTLAVLVPCHRVLRFDGKLGGYRWGRDRKVALLRREGAHLC